jgi:Ca2+-binding RTX toxin-like protein
MAEITGTAGDDVIYGTPATDVINALAGDDTINISDGSDTVDGGNGYDTLVDTAREINRQLVIRPDGSLLVVQGVDFAQGVFTQFGTTIRNVEAIRFADGTVLTAHVGEIETLYETYFGSGARVMDFDYWSHQLANGATLQDVRAAILNDPGGMAHTDVVVTNLYEQYGGRAPTTAELAVWRTNVLAGVEFNGVRNAILYDPLGRAHTTGSVDMLYEQYAGRDPTQSERSAASSQILAGASFADLRNTILDSQAGRAHIADLLTTGYEQYFHREQYPGEAAVWNQLFQKGATADTLLVALLSDYGSAASGVIQLRGDQSVNTETFNLPSNFGDVVIAKFDAFHDTISLAGTPFAGFDLFDPSRVRTVESADSIYDAGTDSTLNLGSIGNGEQDVLITLDATHHIVIREINREQYLSHGLFGGVGGDYQQYFNRGPTSGEAFNWRAAFAAGATPDTLVDTLLSDGAAVGVRHFSGGAAAETFDLGSQIGRTVIDNFTPGSDTISLHGTRFAGMDPLAHAREVTALDGTKDVYFSFEHDSELLLHHVQLAQLHNSDFLI